MGCCSAVNCTSNSRYGKRLFRFPKDPDRRRRWVINCRRANWTPTLYSVLCEDHFEESQYELHRADGWKKLKPNAIPTLFNIPYPPKTFMSAQLEQLKKMKPTPIKHEDDDSSSRQLHVIYLSPLKKENKIEKSRNNEPTTSKDENNYVEILETKIKLLNQRIKQLEDENKYLRQVYELPPNS